MARKQAPRSYLERLLSELDTIANDYVAIIEQSEIKYINPNRPGGIIFIGAADWGWAPSTPELEAARMALLQRVRDWEPRFRLLFPHPTPEVSERLQRDQAHEAVAGPGWEVRPLDTARGASRGQRPAPDTRVTTEPA